ncbi:glycosyltransferase family 39 protein [Kutzneria buriramensis]|uniref:4-amino-4-deoxy-L-arabinose transferase-like glycosyltransferase n=1 Tax=Kutzneria buriramensis TaxID=1045776 RepID=A0A3E0HP10_9PSEU|nr:glycosyltransferase family 39 protein [Kutzneria buriramensis]REH48243.1 4-amino-4-deoxy-L-arabinose transferase-like glycosyltransferase [Kutzneria buriramensis]
MTTTMTRHAAAPAADAPGRRPGWHRPTLVLLLLGTAVLYLWDLSASGYANDFYAQAALAGSQNWEALLFGSLDPGNVITVDKPPAALWVMGLSARIFGFNSWSLLAPQALEGVLSVWLLYAAVRRRFGHGAGLAAGAVLALTPVAVLMFRFDNPDALLVLLMTAGAYCVVRATEKASGKWLALAGVAIGFAFLTKMLQGFLVLPAFGVVYLVAAPTSLRRRIFHLLGALGAVIVSAGWFVALVDLWPASSRPYIGGSTNNSLLELALGYNGLGRIFGGSGNGGGGGFGGGGGGGAGGGNLSFGGSAGITRMFGQAFGTEISWLLPAALIALVAGLWFTRRAPRTDQTRAAVLLWGGWLLVTGLVFSFMSGTIHPYYSVALAPAIAALVAIVGRQLWRGRAKFSVRAWLAAMIGVTGVWDFVLLSEDSTWLPWLRWIVLGASVIVAALVLLQGDQFRRLIVVAALAGVLGTAAFGVATAATPHTGSIPVSGPSSNSGFGGGGGPGSDNGTASSALVSLLQATTTEWAAATDGSMSSAPLALASGKSVMAIGGFNGGDPAPSLAQFQKYVAEGRITYYVSGGRGGFGGGAGGSSQIASWVAAHYKAQTVGGTTVYNLLNNS